MSASEEKLNNTLASKLDPNTHRARNNAMGMMALVASIHEQEREIHNVEHRRSVEIAFAFLKWHPVVERVNVGENIGVSQHNALGMASRAARVNESQNRVWIIKVNRTRAARNRQGFPVENQLP